MTLTVEDLKQVHRATWAAGDYAAVADSITAPVADVLVARAAVEPGEDVLDVASGPGPVALRAAQAGAQATALDLTPELFETGRRRAAELGVTVDWVEGDAEALDFEDERFDCVLSAFGVQFAPRHEIAARELVRVCRPGGRIALANWTSEGQVGEIFQILGRNLPKPPDYASPPPKWGAEGHVRALFAGTGVELERTAVDLAYDSAEHYVSFMETCYGPLLKARERLTGEGRWEDCRRELVGMMERRDEGEDGTLRFGAEYLVVLARKG